MIKTVKIKAPEVKATGYMIINESDFSPDTMQLFGATPPGFPPLELLSEDELKALLEKNGVEFDETLEYDELLKFAQELPQALEE